MHIRNHPENSLDSLHLSTVYSSATCYKYVGRNYVIAVWLKMAKSVFCDVVVYMYSVSALACSHLTFTKKLLSSLKALFEGKDIFIWLSTKFGNSTCYQILPFVSDHKLGPIRSGKSIGVLVISAMVSLLVDHSQKL